MLLTITKVSNEFVFKFRVVGVPSPQCHPSVVGSMPPRIRKICQALETIMEFSDSMETFLDEKGQFRSSFHLKKIKGNFFNSELVNRIELL